MKIGLDTNVLAYAEGVNGPRQQEVAFRLIRRLDRRDVVVPLQALKELFNVLTRKMHWPADLVRERILEWCKTTITVETSQAGLLAAIDLCIAHKLAIWDALILAAAAEAGCRIVLSEDMQHGFTWRGLTVVNPFVAPMHPLLVEAVAP